MDITVTLPDSAKKVLDSWLGVDGINAWAQHAVENKLRQRRDASIEEDTNYNASKLTNLEKDTALESIKLPTKEEREAKDTEDVKEL